MLATREIRVYGIALLLVFLAIDLAAVGVLLSPWGHSRQSLQRSLNSLKNELNAKTKEVDPSRGMDKKLVSVAADASAFYQRRLPTLYSEIDGALGAAAKESGVHLSSVTYGDAPRREQNKNRPPVAEGLRTVEISLKISGQYVEDVKFINALERSRVFFVVNSVSLVGETGSAGRSSGVGLQLVVETYLRRETA